MARKSSVWKRLGLWTLGLILLVGAIGGGVLASGVLDRHPAYLDLPREAARRKDLHVSVRAGGDVETGQKTLIECKLENYRVSSQMSTTRASGSSTIIELIEDGTRVEEGEVLARLDSSEYEELVRQHEILVLQAEADLEKARLDLEAAEIALREYRDGQLAQLREDYRSQIVLYQADIQRQKDRLAWDEKMLDIGYVSEGELLKDQTALERSEINLKRVQGELANLERYTAPIQIKRLESAMDKAREELSYQKMRALHREEQLQKFVEQVEACTIRAPHAGMVIYANEDDDDIRIELGVTVREDMDMFYLPDLSEMEVHATIHESMMDRIESGQPALIRVNGLPGLTLEGHVKSIAPLPMPQRSWRSSDEIKNFLAKITFHTVPPNLLPGMTAEVEIFTDHRPGSLVVPSSAVTIEGGREVCYVVRDDRLERRVVEVAPGDIVSVEVLSGLAEGDEVILDPSRLDPADVLAAETVAGPDPASIRNQTASESELYATQ